MQALNRAYEDADMFRKMMDKVEKSAEPAPARNISREVDEWNERVEREQWEKQKRKQFERRTAAERLKG